MLVQIQSLPVDNYLLLYEIVMEYKLATCIDKDLFIELCNDLIRIWYEPIWWICVTPKIFEYTYVSKYQYNQAFIKRT